MTLNSVVSSDANVFLYCSVGTQAMLHGVDQCMNPALSHSEDLHCFLMRDKVSSAHVPSYGEGSNAHVLALH